MRSLVTRKEDTTHFAARFAHVACAFATQSASVAKVQAMWVANPAV